MVTTTPAFLKADIVRFQGSDWPGWCSPRCWSPRFRRSRPGNCCGTGGRGSGVGREGYRVSRLFQFDWKVRVRTTALGPTISSASSTSALADLTCSGVSRAPPRGPPRCQPWRGRSSPPPRGCRPLAWSRAPWDSPAGEKKKRGASVKSNANRGFNLGHALQLADDASPSTSARTTKKLLKFWTRRRLALDTLSTPSPPLVQSNRVPVPNPVSKKGLLARHPRGNPPPPRIVPQQSCINHLPPALLRGGVLGLLPIMLPKPPMSFLSAGFKIWNEHMRFSSTVIIAPALSNSPQ